MEPQKMEPQKKAGSAGQPQQGPAARPEQKNEGEGSREADLHYREGVKKTVESGRVEELGEAAKEALEGEEGDELRRAEKEAKERGKSVPTQQPRH